MNIDNTSHAAPSRRTLLKCMAAAGAGIVAVALLWKRADVLRDFRRRLAMSRTELKERLQREISAKALYRGRNDTRILPVADTPNMGVLSAAEVVFSRFFTV